MRGSHTKRVQVVRDRILQVVGIAPTKTPAKLANYIAKTAERKPSSHPAELAQVCNLAATEVGEVWGVGRRISEQLRACGAHTVLDLARLSPATAWYWSAPCANCRASPALAWTTPRHPSARLPAYDRLADR